VVKEWLLSQREALHNGAWVENDQVTLSEFLDRYMVEVVTHTVRPTTWQLYERYVRLHIKPELGNIRVIHLSPEKIQDFYSAKLNQGYSHSSVIFMHYFIERCLKHAQRLGLVNRNVAELVEAPTRQSSTPQTLSLEQVKKLLVGTREDRYYALFALAVTTGMREGELLGLMWEDIDFFSSTIHVHRSLTYLQGEGLIITEPPTEKGNRYLAVPEFVLDALWDLKEKTGDQSGLVFHTRNNAPIFAKNIHCHLKKLLKENGLPLIRFHDLRHTAATLLLSGEVHPKVVQEMLGHACIKNTLDIYSHVMPDIQRSAAEKMNDLLE
jgi:integrase